MNIFGESKRVTLIKAYRELFKSDAGKEVLYDLCKASFVYTTTMDAPHEMAYKEGSRAVLLRILKTIEVDPFELERMIKKQQE